MERREGREPEACGPLEVEVPRLVHDEAVEGHGHELGVGATPQVRLGGDDTGDLVSHGEPRHALAERVDPACVVLADHDGVPVLHHAPGHALRDEHIEPVHRGSPHLHPDLARPRLGGRDLDQCSRSSLVCKSECLHCSLLFGDDGSTYARATAPWSRDL